MHEDEPEPKPFFDIGDLDADALSRLRPVAPVGSGGVYPGPTNHLN